MEHKAPWLFCWVGEVSPEHPGMTCRRVRAGILRTARQEDGARALPSPGRPSRSCPHPPASPPHKSPNQSKPWSMKSPWLFCWAAETSPGRPGHDPQAGHRPTFPAQPGKGPGWGFPGFSGTDPGGIQLGRIPIGGSFGISDRSDKKSVFYKSVSQPL